MEETNSWNKYQHIPHLLTMKPNPRILLGQRLFWTEKKGLLVILTAREDGTPT